ncbi:MAG TPA: hypothetical protein VFB06_11230 [Streptosporangiaceae bacterium]|nr:hypothetical protein [Streptosporangiaceae bacterium]
MGHHAITQLWLSSLTRRAAAFLAAVFKGPWCLGCDCCGTTLKKGRRTRWFLTREAADRAGLEAGWQTAAGRSDSEICPACLEQRGQAVTFSQDTPAGES